MAAGLLMTRLIRLIHLPNVTAYLIAGVLIGPCVFNLVGSEELATFSVITECALGCAQIHGYHFHRGAGLHRLLHRR